MRRKKFYLFIGLHALLHALVFQVDTNLAQIADIALQQDGQIGCLKDLNLGRQASDLGDSSELFGFKFLANVALFIVVVIAKGDFAAVDTIGIAPKLDEIAIGRHSDLVTSHAVEVLDHFDVLTARYNDRTIVPLREFNVETLQILNLDKTGGDAILLFRNHADAELIGTLVVNKQNHAVLLLDAFHHAVEMSEIQADGDRARATILELHKVFGVEVQIDENLLVAVSHTKQESLLAELKTAILDVILEEFSQGLDHKSLRGFAVKQVVGHGTAIGRGHVVLFEKKIYLHSR